ncbi:hypothetical protein CA13_08930 [Planctomycetes bacterium CA13]|uniref:Uncharacterized protein n=1 Tax=Novipirellula herctigrandis TaxID=2527986 RepID=A0A5C5YXW6_9BACT|nr:hypothetical protein CA13_08930 [Planctomycetes bacterium CA13]
MPAGMVRDVVVVALGATVDTAPQGFGSAGLHIPGGTKHIA